MGRPSRGHELGELAELPQVVAVALEGPRRRGLRRHPLVDEPRDEAREVESERDGHDVGLGLQRPPHRLPQRRGRGAAVAHHLADQQLVEPRGDARDRARAVRSVPVAVAVAVAGEVALRDRNVRERRVGRVDAGVEQRDAHPQHPSTGCPGHRRARPGCPRRLGLIKPSSTARGRTSFMGSTGATSASGAQGASATPRARATPRWAPTRRARRSSSSEPPVPSSPSPVGCTRRMV